MSRAGEVVVKMYGNTLEEVKEGFSHPERQKTEYGYLVEAVSEPDFSLKQMFFKNCKGSFSLSKGVYFVEQGILKVGGVVVEEGKVLFTGDFSGELEGNGLVYFFTSPDFRCDGAEVRDSFDFRKKYWGKICSIVSRDDFAGKRMFMNAGTQSSLEYHVNKKECYYLQEGKLKVGLRVGRAENKSITLEKGDTLILQPGVMHMRICLEDCVIIEVSTKDEDSDSHLVEDGKKYVHKEV